MRDQWHRSPNKKARESPRGPYYSVCGRHQPLAFSPTLFIQFPPVLAAAGAGFAEALFAATTKLAITKFWRGLVGVAGLVVAHNAITGGLCITFALAGELALVDGLRWHANGVPFALLQATISTKARAWCAVLVVLRALATVMRLLRLFTGSLWHMPATTGLALERISRVPSESWGPADQPSNPAHVP